MDSGGKIQKEQASGPCTIAKTLALRIYPDSVLRKLCEPVDGFDSALKDLLHEMLVLMRLNSGIGLAGPQVGILRRLFVCEIENNAVSLINPEIKSCYGKSNLVEGCLSLPEIEVDVVRSQGIRICGYDADGQKVHLTFTGLWARVMQHEIDHLNGILICDRGEPIPAGPCEAY